MDLNDRFSMARLQPLVDETAPGVGTRKNRGDSLPYESSTLGSLFASEQSLIDWSMLVASIL